MVIKPTFIDSAAKEKRREREDAQVREEAEKQERLKKSAKHSESCPKL